jgi:hypothetical protein
MADILYTARATLEQLGSLHRRATVATGATCEFGVHGALMRHYRLQPERELPFPVDYIVAATGG